MKCHPRLINGFLWALTPDNMPGGGWHWCEGFLLLTGPGCQTAFGLHKRAKIWAVLVVRTLAGLPPKRQGPF